MHAAFVHIDFSYTHDDIRLATLQRLKDFEAKNKLDVIQTQRLNYLVQRYEKADNEIQ